MWQDSLNLTLIAETSRKIVSNYDFTKLLVTMKLISNLGEFLAIELWVWSTKISFTTVVLTKSRFQRRLRNIFYYTLSFFPVLLPKEKHCTSSSKTEQWLMSSRRPRAVDNMHFFVFCQTDVVNKQLFSLLSWNNPLSKIKSHSLIPLKRNLSFMRYLFIRYQSGKLSENFL